ncbi:hypothetical protein L596_024938 [Steinernema carpocapsae]|uniref:Lon proteolytic domain-containing protein n=1 Tax=Steinernema carpocapsae TaxID=34508 RepID=A0A4U5M6B0_STECR|nr:hypothetical protein L596_024938 [Steinernema carpocapsae]
MTEVPSDPAPQPFKVKKVNLQKADEVALLKQIQALNLTENQRKKLMSAYNRFLEIKNYYDYQAEKRRLNQIVRIPWNVYTQDINDISKAKETLDASHTGMDKIKNRIYDYMTLKSAQPNEVPPTLCICGPNGIGKASIAKSIANAIGRKFAKVPILESTQSAKGKSSWNGSIVDALIQAGSSNPVIYLQDINYLATSTNAMCDAVDPEKRGHFVDSFIRIPIDLSQVFFICSWRTSYYYSVSFRLCPKLEIIVPHPEGYTNHQKLMIAKKHLLPKNFAKYQFTEGSVRFEEAALETILDEHTCEYGLVQLCAKIDQVCRKAAVKKIQAKEKTKEVLIDVEFVKEVLGSGNSCYPLVQFRKERYLPLGVFFVLYVCGSSGSVWPLEMVIMPKRTHKMLTVTGQVSSVIEEACNIASTYLYSNAEKYKIDRAKWNDSEVHIHNPRGATRKCGPSGGSATVLTMYSLFSGRHIRSDSVVTGELTLSGQITAIGGINSKTTAAQKHGFRRIVLPKENEIYVKEQMDMKLKSEMEIVFVSNVDELFEAMLEKDVTPSSQNEMPKSKL